MPLYEHIAIGLVVALQVLTLTQLIRLTAQVAALCVSRHETNRRLHDLESKQ